jgi:HK97 family phage portal protein
MLIRSLMERRYGDGGSAPLSGINDPSTPLYQALLGAMEGIGPIDGLPAVNYQNALRIPAVWRGTAIQASVPASLPLRFYTRDADGNRQNLPASHPMNWFLERPNPEMTPMSFWETSFAHNVLAGDTYWSIATDQLGRPREVWPLEPRRMKVVRDTGTQRKMFIIDGDANQPAFEYEPDGTGSIIHIPGFSLNGMRGINQIDLQRLALQLMLASEEFGARMFSQGTNLSGILTSDADIDEKTAEKLRSRWRKLNSGLRRAHDIAVMGNGAKFQETTLDPQKAQMIDTRKFQLGEYERMSGVAPHLLGDVEKSTSWGTGIEEQGRNTVTYTLGPTIRRFEDAINFKLLARWKPVYAKFELSGLLRGDTKARYQAYAFGRQWGWLSINDIRRMEDLPPVPGGDEYLTPLNMQPVTDGTESDVAGELDDVTAQLEDLGN